MPLLRALGSWLCLAVVLAVASPALAQGIDCGKARSATEKAICASPALMTLDRQIAGAYADSVARQPAQSAAMRQALIGWLRARDSACAVPASAITACLARQLTDRLAALAPPVVVAPVVAAVAPDPAIPAGGMPQPAGTIERTSLPATGVAETLLHVTSPGRFAIAARGPSGAALQLVDMLAGPSEIAGSAGSQDGRLDELLDVGTYKLRVISAESATGSVTLSLTAFHDAAAPAALPQPGRSLAATLQDGEQRQFWLSVPPGAADATNIRIEAAGRALGDLRLWRDGRELVDLAPDPQRIEPVAGHALTDLRLVGHVEPGTYLAVAYGGAALAWTDNDTAQPLLLRSGASAALDEDYAGGVVGPFGSEIWGLPSGRGQLRLDLPAPAAATLRANGGSVEIARNSRAPSAVLNTSGGDVVELRAAAGQAFTLRRIGATGVTRFSKPGTYFVSAVTSGIGGDEAPPGVLLQRQMAPDKPPAIIASTLPAMDASGWHARFNLRGNTQILFSSGDGGEVAVRSSGVDVTTLRDSGSLANLPPGIFSLRLQPKPGVTGILDLIVARPGLTPPLQAPLPPDPVIPLGVQTVGPGQVLSLIGGSGPGERIGLSARPVPVAVAEGPLTVTLAAATGITIPVQVAPGGTLGVTEIGVGAVTFAQRDGGVSIDPADHARTLVLSWHRDATAPAPIPTPPPPEQTASLAAGTPGFLDLARGEERGLTLTVAEGGLYRIETLGRLHTSARLATPFIANLGAADGNGVGGNALIATMLRAGRYRVDVTANDSSGHLGVLASPAPLLQGATLLAGGSVRASLKAGTGASFPIEIAEGTQHIRLSVEGIGAAWTGRLEDSEGWPLTVPGPLDGIEQTLRPGHYRLLVTPDAVDRLVVARLAVLAKPVEITGHGPHDLPFGPTQTATWREPDGRDTPRAPDQWRFVLAGQAHVTLRLDPGMVGELRRTGSDDAPIRVFASTTATLAAGTYVLDATSLGRNDRLTYGLRLQAQELQPDQPRSFTLPAQIPFDIATARVVSLTSSGTLPVRAVLRRADGTVINRVGARQDDWNIAVSRLLPAGRYRLDLSSAAAPDTDTVTGPASPSYAGVTTDDDSSQVDDPDAPPADKQKQQTAAAPADSASDQPTADATAQADDAPTPKVTLRLALPDSLPKAEAPIAAQILAGQGVHVLTLSQPAPGTLLLAQAQASASLVLALERQDGPIWRTVSLAEGTSPAVASPADSQPASWRVEAWTVDGGPEPITLAARALDLPAQAPGQVALTAVGGMPAGLAAAHVALASPGLLDLTGAPGSVLVGGWPGHALATRQGDIVALQDRDAWLLAPKPLSLAAGTATLATGVPVPLSLPGGLQAPLPMMAAADGHVLLWKAESGSGQPGLGGGMGVAPGSALALGTSGLSLRRADGDDDLRLRLTRLEPALSAGLAVTEPLHMVLPPGTALPVSLPAGTKRLVLDLPAGLAAIAGWTSADAVIAWSGAAPLSRSLAGDWTEILLANPGTAPAPASLSWQMQPPELALRPGVLLKRFFGAAGSLELPLDASAGARVAVAGPVSMTLIETDGTVLRGRALKPHGPGLLVLAHGVGAMAVWVETDAVSPWPSATALPTAMPAHLDMSGAAMALGLTQDRPVLLHATTTAPVLIGLHRAGMPDTPQLFAAGAAFNRLLPAGDSELRLFSPQDGALSGTLDLTAEPVIPILEGVGAPVSVAPGGAVLFGFTLAKPATIGVGVRADPDRATVRLLDESGRPLGQGVAQLRALPAGRYLIEAQVAPGAPPTLIRPAIIGITPRGDGPPPDVAQGYFALVGMIPNGDNK